MTCMLVNCQSKNEGEITHCYVMLLVALCNGHGVWATTPWYPPAVDFMKFGSHDPIMTKEKYCLLFKVSPQLLLST